MFIDKPNEITLAQLQQLFPNSHFSKSITEMRVTIKQLAEDIKRSHTNGDGEWPSSESAALHEYQQLMQLAEN